MNSADRFQPVPRSRAGGEHDEIWRHPLRGLWRPLRRSKIVALNAGDIELIDGKGVVSFSPPNTRKVRQNH
jgi:hypothetical protein